jgi:hypothetical protein
MQRAEVEIALAQRAEHPKAVAAHYFLAQSYLDLVYGDGSKKQQRFGRTDDRERVTVRLCPAKRLRSPQNSASFPVASAVLRR